MHDIEDTLLNVARKAANKLDELVDSFDDKVALQATKMALDAYLKIRTDDTQRMELRVNALERMTPEQIQDFIGKLDSLDKDPLEQRLTAIVVPTAIDYSNDV